MNTRREALLFPFAALMAPAEQTGRFVLSVEGYIFQQYAQRTKRPLSAVIPEALRMAKTAGFRNIELNTAFFANELRDQTLSQLRTFGLQMPSIYVGGAMHSKPDADRTIANALEHGRLAMPFGCKGVVNNPDPKKGDQSKTDDELAAEAEGLNRLGRALQAEGLELRVHHHTPQLENKAREWRYILAHTDPEVVRICVDVDWAYQGGFEAVPFLQDVGKRLRELHVRSARNKLWLEDVEDSDIDYRGVAVYLKDRRFQPLIVVELAYRPETVVTRSLEDDLRRSRLYTERIFGIPASA